jgi:hypothetical protein
MKTATEMTNQELRDAARTYDKVNNEGGEGYNPYSQELERREHEELREQAKAHAKTPQGKIDALYRRIKIECGSVAREWGNTEEIDALQSSLYAEIEKIKAEIDAEFLKIWTLETTKARREEWNNFANGTLIPMSKAGKSAEMHRIMRNREKDQGWTLADLKKAVTLHGLNS